MPIYEYKCESCGHPFERYSAGRGGQNDPGECPRCGKREVKKVFSTFASSGCSNDGMTAGVAGGCGGGSGGFS